MKKIHINFYSYRPRLKVELTWTTDLIPDVGDEIIIDRKFISQFDKKYFKKWRKDYSMAFRVKKRTWDLDKSYKRWNNYDVRLELDWTDEEQKKVEKYLNKFKK